MVSPLSYCLRSGNRTRAELKMVWLVSTNLTGRQEGSVMEKVVYALWRDMRDTREEFSRKLREVAAPKMLALGARGLQVNVVDDVVLGANTFSVATRPQMEGVVHRSEEHTSELQ